MSYTQRRGAASTLGRSATAGFTGWGPAIERALAKPPPAKRSTATGRLYTFTGKATVTPSGVTWSLVINATVSGDYLAPTRNGWWSVTADAVVNAADPGADFTGGSGAVAGGFRGANQATVKGTGVAVASGVWEGPMVPAAGLVAVAIVEGDTSAVWTAEVTVTARLVEAG